MEPGNSAQDLTLWLRRFSEGDDEACDVVASVVYSELHRMAAVMLAKEGKGHSLQPTLMVNEAFLRLLGSEAIDWQGRQHFFALAARMMRRVVIDYFRQKNTQKRPPARMRIAIENTVVFGDDHCEEALIVHEALEKLEADDRIAAQVVELRYFGGFNIAEIAGLMDRSERSIKRDWQFAQAWLKRYFHQHAKVSKRDN